ncbi:hypothetical protein BDP27DRAFT_1423804 [Rhodocollybia butyracea]|uniref:Uncharacterized protein n=1 Tax=Rhodocollybia butyracea TaxID=206335 RepID=A0A9P5PPX5_9AGAR|nr:hypothetical protein BDP27DRAFT_1423804 [Rhodocollybia butyracea]
MSTRTDQNADSASQKGKFMASAMKSIQAAAEQLELTSGKLCNAIEDDADQTILQADVLRATAELTKHVMQQFQKEQVLKYPTNCPYLVQPGHRNFINELTLGPITATRTFSSSVTGAAGPGAFTTTRVYTFVTLTLLKRPKNLGKTWAARS